MIKDEEIEINITNRNKSYFEKLRYFINGNKLKIKTIDLPKNSHVKINVICDICKKEYVLMYVKYYQNKSNYGFFTCKKCSTEKKKMTNLKKFGVDNYAKIEGYGNIVKEINKEKYGDENYNNIEKHKETMLEKYGVEFYMNTKEFKDKSKRSKKEKYGDEFFTNIKKIKKTKKERYGNEFYLNHDKAKQTNLIKYGSDNYTKTDEFRKKLWNFYDDKLKKNELNIININRYDGSVKIICNKKHEYEIPLQLLYDRINIKTETCLICNPINSYSNSGYEIQLQNFIKENYKNEIILNSKKEINKELDIYLKDLKLAFEFNGVYWHNELNVPNNYHLNKTEECEKLGIKLIHIYEDDWIYKQDIVKSRILNLLGKSDKIYARKCEIKEIENNELVKEFLEQNHLQGFIGSKVKIGLFYDNELVSLMTFGSQRKSMGQKSIDETYEMLRFCNKLNINVIGGASRLLKYFIENYVPKEIISYADRSWSTGDLYEKLGFRFVHKTQPNYYYVIGDKRFYRFNYRKDKLIKERADISKTEHEIMLERKIYRIYDSGSLKYKFENKL
jgi:hypothetical protein